MSTGTLWGGVQPKASHSEGTPSYPPVAPPAPAPPLLHSGFRWMDKDSASVLVDVEGNLPPKKRELRAVSGCLCLGRLAESGSISTVCHPLVEACQVCI